MIKKLLVFTFMCAALFSCQQEEEVNPQSSQTSSFDNSKNPFRSMPSISQTAEGQVVKEKKGMEGENASTNCSVETITETRGIQNLTLLEGTDGIIYPGSLFKGESVVSGSYETITGVTKRPMEMTFTIEGLQGNPVRTIIPTNGNYFTEYNNILNTPINGAQPANISYTVEEIKSEEYLDLAVGANLKLGPLFSIKADFDFNSQDNKTRIMAKLVQSYFTVDMSIPEDGVYIEEYPDPEIFGQYSPMYVSSLNYGRMAHFFIETTYSKDEIMAALEASFRLFVKSEGSVSLEQKNMISSSTIRVLVRGGSGTDAVQSINGYNEFKSYVTQGGEMTNTSRGEIISYNLRNLSNHTNAVINLSADYEEKYCKIPVYQYWNPNVHDYFYSTDGAQSDILNNGWQLNGGAFAVYEKSSDKSVPVYQYWHPTKYDHFYSLNDSQQDVISSGWQLQGVAFYSPIQSVSGASPVYQYWNPVLEDHFYSLDGAHQAMINNGWNLQGVAFYGFY